MDERYRRYNEITFIQCCMTSIDHAVNRARREKQLMAQREVSLNDLENMGASFPLDQSGQDGIQIPEAVFEVDGLKIPIVNAELAKALTYLPPQKRRIFLLAYLIGDSDAELSKTFHISKSAAQRRRNDALKKIQEYMTTDESCPVRDNQSSKRK